MEAEVMTLPSLEERTLRLEERRIAVEERKLANEARANRTPEEASFELEMRMATSLAQSPFLPTTVGKDPNERIAAAWGVLRYANMLGVDAYVLAQQIHIVKGKLGFSTQFLIALVNGRANLQSELDWTVSGTWGAKDLSVTCAATDKRGAVRSVTMTRTQVDTWGWAGTDPWKADPVLMMKYRTAAQLIRLYFAGSVMGLTTTSEELRDTPETVEVRVMPRGAAALGGTPEPRALPDHGDTGRDFDAERRAAEERARVPVSGAEGGAPPNNSPTLPPHVDAWLDGIDAEQGLPRARVMAFLTSKGFAPATMTPQQVTNANLKLGTGGSWREAFDTFGA